MPWLWQRGIAPEQVLVVGARDSMVAVLQDQIARRRAGELPIVAEDPSWTLAVEGIDPRLERAHESLLTIADGVLGTRGSVIVPHSSGDPAVLMSGIYARAGSESHGMTWMRARGRPASIVAALHGRVRGRHPKRVLDRVATYEGTTTRLVDHSRALKRLRGARKIGNGPALSLSQTEHAPD